MELWQLALLFSAAAVAGTLNAFVGGGSFVAFPALLLVGLPPIVANATASYALCPAALASALVYRKSLPEDRRVLSWLLVASCLGAVGGSLLLLGTPEGWFLRAIPLFLLGATLILTFGPRLTKALGGRGLGLGFALLVQLLISAYGGYFGAGMGVLMMANLALYGLSSTLQVNAIKTILAVIITGVSVLLFAYSGKIAFGPGTVMILGSVVGGVVGARLARGLSNATMRGVVVAIAWTISVVFLVRSAFA